MKHCVLVLSRCCAESALVVLWLWSAYHGSQQEDTGPSSLLIHSSECHNEESYPVELGRIRQIQLLPQYHTAECHQCGRQAQNHLQTDDYIPAISFRQSTCGLCSLSSEIQMCKRQDKRRYDWHHESATLSCKGSSHNPKANVSLKHVISWLYGHTRTPQKQPSRSFTPSKR